MAPRATGEARIGSAVLNSLNMQNDIIAASVGVESPLALSRTVPNIRGFILRESEKGISSHSESSTLGHKPPLHRFRLMSRQKLSSRAELGPH